MSVAVGTGMRQRAEVAAVALLVVDVRSSSHELVRPAVEPDALGEAVDVQPDGEAGRTLCAPEDEAEDEPPLCVTLSWTDKPV